MKNRLIRLKRMVGSLFWPIGVSVPISQAGHEDLDECIKDWSVGLSREPKEHPDDVERRKRNWRVVGPYFKNYLIRWAGTLVLMICLGLFSPLKEVNSSDTFGLIFGSFLVLLTWVSGILTAIHGCMHLKYIRFKKGQEVWK